MGFITNHLEEESERTKQEKTDTDEVGLLSVFINSTMEMLNLQFIDNKFRHQWVLHKRDFRLHSFIQVNHKQFDEMQERIQQFYKANRKQY